MPILKLFDGETTLNLIDKTAYNTLYTPGLGIARAPNLPSIAGNTLSAIEFKPRDITMMVDVLGTSQDDMTANISALERMIGKAQKRQIQQAGTTKVVLIVQQGTNVASDVTYTVITGHFSLSTSVILSTHIDRLRTRGTLTLTCEPEGKLPVVTLGRKLLHSEQDGTNINHVDIGDGWGGFFKFDGAATQIACGSDSSIDNIWGGGGYARVRFRVDDFSANHTLIAKGQWSLETNTSGELSFRHLWSGDNYRCTSTDANLKTGVKYVVELEYDSDAVGNDCSMILSTDGATGMALTLTEVETPTGTRTTDASNNFEIGRIGTERFAGDIWDAALFDAGSITEDETKELDGNETNLVGYWNFSEGTGTTVRDNSSNTNNGTITPGTGSWGVDPTRGNAGGLLQIRLEDAVGPSTWTAGKNLYIATRSGERRTDVLFDQVPNSVTDVNTDIFSGSETSTKGITGGPTANTSGGTSAFFRSTSDAANGTIQQGFFIRGYFTYTFPGASLPRGLYRVIARCQNKISTSGNPDIGGFSLSHSFGGQTTTPVTGETVSPPAEDNFYNLDLGLITIPTLATPDGFTSPDLDIRVNCVLDTAKTGDWDGTDFIEWSCNFLFLVPEDEGSLLVRSVDATDEILADLISERPNVWLLNTSSVTQEIADIDGAPIRLSVEATRVYVLKDDILDPSDIQLYANLKYTPLVRGL